VLVFGPPGGGKSTFSTTVALSLAATRRPVLYVSAEEGHADTAVERFRRCAGALGLDKLPHGLLLSDARTPEEVTSDVEMWQPERGDALLVLDSATELRAAPAWLDSLLVRPRLGLLVVQHVTTSGLPRGGLEPAFAVDVTLRCADLMAVLTKNRWGPCSRFDVRNPVRHDDASSVERVIHLEDHRAR
jgi:hypothetical protein